MTKTGVFVSETMLRQIKALMEPSITMDLGASITTVSYGDKEAAFKLLDAYAVEQGLPVLPKNGHYGLTSDRELVTV